MAITYVALANVTVGSGGAADMEFTNIPGTYTDLKIVVSGRTSTASYSFDYLYISFNGSTADYTLRELQGDGSTAYSYTRTTYGANYAGRLNGDTSTSNTFSNVELYFPNYAGSNNKSISIDSVQETNGTTAYASLIAGLWSQTAAITSIKLTTALANFKQYSTATLYGIKNS